MAQYPVRVNLTAMGFPLLSEYSGRSVILKQQDQNYIPASTARDVDTREIGIAQAIYCHNVIATSQGYQSINYELQITLTGRTDILGQIAVQEASTGNKAYICWSATGLFYYCSAAGYAWSLANSIPTAAGKEVTYAYVNGVGYIYIANVVINPVGLLSVTAVLLLVVCVTVPPAPVP